MWLFEEGVIGVLFWGGGYRGVVLVRGLLGVVFGERVIGMLFWEGVI